MAVIYFPGSGVFPCAPAHLPLLTNRSGQCTAIEISSSAQCFVNIWLPFFLLIFQAMSTSPLSNLAPAMLASEVMLAMMGFLSPALKSCFPALGLVEIPDFFFPFLFFCEETKTYPGCCYHHKILFWFSILLPLTGMLSGQWGTEPRLALNTAVVGSAPQPTPTPYFFLKGQLFFFFSCLPQVKWLINMIRFS